MDQVTDLVTKAIGDMTDAVAAARKDSAEGLDAIRTEVTKRLDELAEGRSVDRAKLREIEQRIFDAGPAAGAVGGRIIKADPITSLLRSESFAALATTKEQSRRVFETKATLPTMAKALTSAHDSPGGSPTEEANVPGIQDYIGEPFRDPLLLDAMTRIPVLSGKVEAQRSAHTRNAAKQTTEGAAKAENLATWVQEDVTIPTFAAYFTVSEQVLADIAQLDLMLRDELRGDVLEAFEADAYSELTTNGTTYSGYSASTLVDRIRQAKADMLANKYRPTYVAIHPNDAADMDLEKDSAGQYIAGGWKSGEAGNVWRLRAIESPVVTEGSATLIDPNTVALYDREQLDVQVGWVNDNFTKNLVTIRGELRAKAFVRRAGGVYTVSAGSP